MNTKNISADNLLGVLVETKTDSILYEGTDCQVSNTASIQHEFISGNNLILTVQDAPNL